MLGFVNILLIDDDLTLLQIKLNSYRGCGCDRIKCFDKVNPYLSTKNIMSDIKGHRPTIKPGG